MSIPILFLSFNIDIFNAFGLSPGFSWKKSIFYEVFLLGSFWGILILVWLTRKRWEWVTVGLLWALCSITVLGTYYATQARWMFPLFYAKQEQTIVIPTIPSLRDMYRDKSWKVNIHKFGDFHEQAELQRSKLQLDLEEAGLMPQQAQVSAYMLFVSSFWDYGNPTMPERVGCVASNEENGWKTIPVTELKAETYARSNIGCCIDFAYLLKRILDDSQIESRLVTIQGHIFNEAKIDGRWHMVDASTNLFIDQAWSELGDSEKCRIYQFTHPGSLAGEGHRPIIPAFQSHMMNRAVMGMPGAVTYPDLPAHIANYP